MKCRIKSDGEVKNAERTKDLQDDFNLHYDLTSTASSALQCSRAR